MRRLVGTAARLALDSTALVPPPRPATFPDGPTAELRDAMARFSHGDDHRAPRRDVEQAIERLDTELLVREVTERTNALAAGGVEAIDAIGRSVPTQALLAALHVNADDVAARGADVLRVVEAIGRGEPVSADTEAATRRLMTLFADHPDGPVAAISMLYQNHDATAALFASTLLARASGAPRENALARTVRVATEPVHLAAGIFDDDADSHSSGDDPDSEDDRNTDIDAPTVVDAGIGTMIEPEAEGVDESIDEGEIIEVSLDGDDMEFGHGVHACPGQTVAVLIVEVMDTAIELLDLTVDMEHSDVAPDGRAITLVLTD